MSSLYINQDVLLNLEPAKPTINADSGTDSNNIMLTWTSDDDGKHGVTYTVSCSGGGGDCSPSDAIDENKVTITGLDSATEYTLRVTAYYKGKPSVVSEVETVTTSKYNTLMITVCDTFSESVRSRSDRTRLI